MPRAEWITGAENPAKDTRKVVLIACGALAREVATLIDLNHWRHVRLVCLPATLHNRPERITAAVKEKIHSHRQPDVRIFVLYGDCGTGGALDRMLEEEAVERIPGPHCYAFFSGVSEFLDRAETEFDCFYLTDFLARQFDTLIWKGLGLDQHPELLGDYFGHYSKLVYLAQSRDPALDEKARAAARKLGLQYERRETEMGDLATFMQGHVAPGITDTQLHPVTH